jgi:hypothetical protein
VQRIRVLDPTAPPPDISPDPGPVAGALTGRRVGIRFDNAWQSFITTTAEWGPRLESAGANLRWWNAGSRVGEEGERTRRELQEFVDAVDVAIVGLGN